MPTFLIRHRTVYRYRNPVAFGEHRFMLRSRDGFDQRTLEHGLTITPEPTDLAWWEDASGNLVGHARFGRRARELRFEAVLKVEQTCLRDTGPSLAEHARTCPFSYGQEEMPDLARFIERQEPDPEHRVDRWSGELLRADPARSTWAFLVRLTRAIRHDFAYLRREEPGIQPPALTLARRQGSCRDFASLMMEAARAQGLASRFVSGYLYASGHDNAAARAGGSTHAWLQVYLPGGGWIDFDPASGTVGNAGLIRVATVRDPRQAAPLGGTFIGFPSDYVGMTVDVDVRRADGAEGALCPGVAA